MAHFRKDMSRTPSPQQEFQPQQTQALSTCLVWSAIQSPGRPSTTSVEEYQRCSKAGCTACKMVLDIFNAFMSGWPDESSMFDPALIRLYKYSDHFTIYQLKPKKKGGSVRFYQLQGKISSSSVYSRRFPSSPSPTFYKR